MTELEKRKLKAKLHKEVINTIAYCVGDGYDEDFQFALEYVKHLMEIELSYYGEKDEDVDDANVAMRESLGNNWW